MPASGFWRAIRNCDRACVLRIAARRSAGLRHRGSLSRLQSRHQPVVARMLGILEDSLEVGRKDWTTVVGKLDLGLVNPAAKPLDLGDRILLGIRNRGRAGP